MKISVVIATFQRREVLARTLPSVFAQDFPAADYEVIVVVDGSRDGTLEFLRDLRPACRMQVLQQENRGQAAARNAGWRAARGELVLLLDDDILCEPDLLAQHWKAHQQAGSLLSFGPVRTHPDSRAGLAVEIIRSELDSWYHRLEQGQRMQWPEDFVVFPNSCLPRQLLEKVGGFDENFFRAAEDTELAMRLYAAGASFRYLPGARAYQLYVKRGEDVIDAARWFGRSDVLLLRKCPHFRANSRLRLLARGSIFRRSLRQIAIRMPLTPDPLLALPFRVLRALRRFPSFHRAAMRLFFFRRDLVYFRAALRQAGSWQALKAEFGMRVPVLLYHHVGARQAGAWPGLTVSPGEFANHVRWLRKWGYTGITASQWLAWRREGRPLPAKPVVITFDDAYSDIAEHALPLLLEQGFRATVFLVSGKVGKSNSWDVAQGRPALGLMGHEQIRHWAARGIEFGAHSRSHADLCALDSATLSGELAGCADDIARLAGQRPVAFAYPYGSHNPQARRLAAEVFNLAFTTAPGLNTLSTDPCVLKRLEVWPGERRLDLWWRLRLGWSPFADLRMRWAGRSGRGTAFLPSQAPATAALRPFAEAAASQGEWFDTAWDNDAAVGRAAAPSTARGL